MKIFLTLVIFFSAISTAQAETRYIEDQLKLPMRTGQGLKYSIARMIPSGTEVEILEQNEETGYSHIRTPGGKEGWVLSRYLMKTPAARERLADAEKKLAEIEKEKAQLNTGLNAIQQKKDFLEQKFSNLKDKNMKLVKELETIRHVSANAMGIAKENKTLRSKVAVAERELQSLRQETRELKNGEAQKWFLLGGGAILLGILLGIFLPNLRMQKRSRWGRY